MRILETKVFSFNELNEDAKEKAIERFRNFNVQDSFWYEDIFDNFKEEKGNKYFDIERIYFSGFWSQGDGAMFEYSGIKEELYFEVIESLKLPKWKKEILKICFIDGNGKHSGHYYHYNSCSHSISIYLESGNYHWSSHPNIYEFLELYIQDIEEYIVNEYKELAKELYRMLESNYEYYTSDEQIIETILANDYEFIEGGELI
jgi:hypothetical protein